MYKTIILETAKAKVLMIDGLHEDATAIRLVSNIHKTNLDCFNSTIVWTFSKDHQGFFDLHGIGSANWQTLGWLQEITEEHWTEVVEKRRRGWKYYWKDKGFVPRGFNHLFKTATESALSLIEANVVRANKYGETLLRENTYRNKHIYGGPSLLPYKDYKNRWLAAESEVYRNPFLFMQKK